MAKQKYDNGRFITTNEAVTIEMVSVRLHGWEPEDVVTVAEFIDYAL